MKFVNGLSLKLNCIKHNGLSLCFTCYILTNTYRSCLQLGHCVVELVV